MTMLTKVLANENSYDKNPDKPIVVGGVVFPDQVCFTIIIILCTRDSVQSPTYILVEVVL